MNDSCESPCSSSSSSCPPLLTPTGSGPDVVGMFDMDPSDSLSSSSGQQNFDPMRHTFSEEELKPQPMIKKARKILVPDNMKVSLHVTKGTLTAVVSRLHLGGVGGLFWSMIVASFEGCRSLTSENIEPENTVFCLMDD